MPWPPKPILRMCRRAGGTPDRLAEITVWKENSRHRPRCGGWSAMRLSNPEYSEFNHQVADRERRGSRHQGQSGR